MGDFNKYTLFIALKGCIYMADHQMPFNINNDNSLPYLHDFSEVW